ncbi:unnamed protein product, partial [Ectocarpus sp. 12 AP-2014]
RKRRQSLERISSGVTTRSIGTLVARRLTKGNTSKEDTKCLRITRGLEAFEGSGNYRTQGLRKSPRERSSPRRTCLPTGGKDTRDVPPSAISHKANYIGFSWRYKTASRH